MNLFDQKTIIQHLQFVHSVIVASEPLLVEAMSELQKLSSDDDLELLRYYGTHLEEERGHAEWLRQDLESAGVSIGNAIDWSAACLAGAQYYLIKHVHPAMLLGYMAALENPMPLEMVGQLEEAHGKSLIRTLRHHAEHDGAHAKDISKMISMMPEPLQSKIAENASQTTVMWMSACRRYGNG